MDDAARTAGGTLGEYMTRGDGNERSMADVVRDIIVNVQEMVRSEVRLAKAELREEASKSVDGVKLLGIAAGLGLFAAAFLLVCIAQLLALVMPAWAASLLLAVALGVIAAVMLSKGKQLLRVPKPRKTIDNVKENVEWMKSQTRS